MYRSVLFLCSTFPRYSGDTQAPFVLEQARAWKERWPSDSVCVLAPHDAGARREEEYNQVKVRRFRYFWPEQWQKLVYPAILPNLKKRPWLFAQVPLLLASEFLAAYRFTRTHKTDFIYAHWVIPQGLVAHLLFLTAGKPYFLHNHSSDLDILGSLGWFGRLIARRIITHSAALLCTNEEQKQFALGLLSTEQRQSNAHKVVVMPMGVNAIGNHQQVEHCSSSYRYQFGTISRLTNKKGIDYIIQAASIFPRHETQTTLAIAGDGEERDRLEQLASGEDVVFTGFLDEQEKWPFFGNCQFIVFASKVSHGDVEGMPVTLLEALTMGKMVLASHDTNIQLLPEWPQIQDCVEFIDDPSNIDALRNAMLVLTKLGTKEIERRSKKLRHVMQRYLWPQLINEYQTVTDENLRQQSQTND